MPENAKQIQEWRKALDDEFFLQCYPDPDKPGKGKMYGCQPWASLYNYLAEQHVA